MKTGVIGVIASLLVAGCSTPQPPELNYRSQPRNWDLWAVDDRPTTEKDSVSVEVESFTIHIMPLDELNAVWDEIAPDSPNDVWGFCLLETREVFVSWAKWRWDVDGFPLPDLDTLGHEIWHLPDLGARWHE